MLSMVITFALITAIFEAALLLKLSSLRMLEKKWFVNTVHVLAIMFNLAVHWGTIVGTMTAITAGLVSFATVPVVKYIFATEQTWRPIAQSVMRSLSSHVPRLRRVFGVKGGA